MSSNSIVRARVDDDVKRAADAALAGMGLTISDAIRILLTRVARDKALSFDLVPNALTIETMRKSERGEEVYEDVEALFRELGA